MAVARAILPGRSLPANTEAEKALLGGVFVDPSVMVGLRTTLRPEDFFNDVHRRVYQAMLTLDDNGKPLDLVSVADVLAREDQLERIGGPPVLMEIASYVPTAAGVGYYSEMLKGLSLRRQLIQVAGRIAEEAYEHPGEVKELLDGAEQRIMSLSQQDRQTSFVTINEAALRTVRVLEKLYKSGNAITGLASGFADLDRMTSGWQPGDLIILAGRPSMGKTSLALNMCLNAALRGSRVAIFSLEMPVEQLVMRMISSEAEIPFSRMRTGTFSRDDWYNLTRVTHLVQSTRIHLDDSPGVTLADLRSQCRKLAADPALGVDLVMIDYLQLMSGPADRARESREQEISAISRGLKMLAKELKIPIIALSQLNRSPEGRIDKRPHLSDLRESGAIEQDADVIGFIYRDEVYNKETEKKGIAEVIIGKQRNGPIGTVDLRFNGEFTKFSNLDRFHGQQQEEGGAF